MPQQIKRSDFNLLRQLGFQSDVIYELSSDAIKSYIKKYNEINKNPKMINNISKEPLNPTKGSRPNKYNKPLSSKKNKNKNNKKPLKIDNFNNIEYKGQNISKGPKNLEYFKDILLSNYKKARKMDIRSYIKDCYQFCINSIRRPLNSWQQFVKSNFPEISCFHLLEGINIDVYMKGEALSSEKRNIDILEFGRNMHPLHEILLSMNMKNFPIGYI